MFADVVIVGGGFCGVHIAKKLDKLNLSTIFIDKKQYFEFIPAIPKLVTDSKHVKKIRIPYSFRKVKFVKDEITLITEKEVRTKKNSFSFRFLIITAGSVYPIPLKNTKKVFILKNSNDALKLNSALKNAENILIVGGGLIGTELAGEFATKTNKKITILEQGPRLLGRNAKSASNFAYDFLRKRTCEIIFGEKLINYSNNTIVTDKKEISHDLIVWCAGTKPNSSFIRGKLLNSLNEKGNIQVNSFLQVKGFDNIFCGGDVNDVPEEKTAQNADRHARIIVHNLRALLGKKNKMVKHKPRSGPLVISLGDWNGIFVFKNFVLKGFIPGLMKHIIEKVLLFQIKYL